MTSEGPTDKPTTRRLILERIAALDPAERRHQERGIIGRFGTLPGMGEARSVLLYTSHFPEEVQTRELLAQVLAWGKMLACPRIDRRARRLRLHLVGDPVDVDVAGPFGILEPKAESPVVPPEAIDWALVPGLGFDPDGGRLGRGGGYYDRLLGHLRPEAPRWALALDPQLLRSVPTEPHDQPIDGIALGDRLIECPRRRSELPAPPGD